MNNEKGLQELVRKITDDFAALNLTLRQRRIGVNCW